MFKRKEEKHNIKTIEKKNKNKVSSTLGLKKKDKPKEKRKGVKGVYDSTIGQLDKTTRVYTYLGLIVIVFTISLFFESLIRNSGDEVYEIYTDTDLNFRLAIPHGWQAAKPEVENVQKAVTEVTKDVEAFDMVEHSLGKEVVPLAILNSDTEGKTFAEFATMSFRGSEKEFLYLDDLVGIKDDIKSLLESTDNKKVEVYDVSRTELNGIYEGILVKAKAEYGLEPVDYYVWHEKAGANILTLTYGATGKSEREMMKSLEFLIGGLVYDQPTFGMSEEEEKFYVQLVKEKQAEIEAEQFLAEDGTGATQTNIIPTLPTWGGNVEDKEETTEEKEADVKEEIEEEPITNILPTLPKGKGEEIGTNSDGLLNIKQKEQEEK